MTYQLTTGDTILRTADNKCIAANCNKTKLARGFCKLHYDRIKRTGSPDDTEKSFLRSADLWEHFDYFFSQTARTTNGCLEWVGSRNVLGYGRIMKGGRTYFAHRLSYQKAFGINPGGKEVCHKCDNPCCVNPEHLFLGTTQDNALDREAKGRGNHDSKKKEYVFMSPSGERVTVFGLNAFCKMNNLSQPKMSEVWLGTRKQHKGWTRHV